MYRTQEKYFQLSPESSSSKLSNYVNLSGKLHFYIKLRQDSKKLGRFLGKSRGKLRQTAEHNGQAICSQVQMVTREEGLAGDKTRITRTSPPG